LPGSRSLAPQERLSQEPSAILIPHQHKVTLSRGAGDPPFLDQQHECEQPHHLGFVRHTLSQESSQANGLRAVVLADKPFPRAHLVALVEDQIDDRKYDHKTVRKVSLTRNQYEDRSPSSHRLVTQRSSSDDTSTCAVRPTNLLWFRPADRP
jgi:hypothetical protein